MGGGREVAKNEATYMPCAADGAHAKWLCTCLICPDCRTDEEYGSESLDGGTKNWISKEVWGEIEARTCFLKKIVLHLRFCRP